MQAWQVGSRRDGQPKGMTPPFHTGATPECRDRLAWCPGLFHAQRLTFLGDRYRARLEEEACALVP